MTIQTPTKPRGKREAILTPQRKQLILNLIHEYRRMHEISPTFLEIAVGIGYTATMEGTAYTYVMDLIREGWLRRAAPGARAILPVYPPTAVYHEITDPDLKVVAHRQKNLRILRRI